MDYQVKNCHKFNKKITYILSTVQQIEGRLLGFFFLRLSFHWSVINCIITLSKRLWKSQAAGHWFPQSLFDLSLIELPSMWRQMHKKIDVNLPPKWLIARLQWGEKIHWTAVNMKFTWTDVNIVIDLSSFLIKQCLSQFFIIKCTSKSRPLHIKHKWKFNWFLTSNVSWNSPYSATQYASRNNQKEHICVWGKTCRRPKQLSNTIQSN